MSEQIKRIHRELAYQGKIVKVYTDTMEMPDGHTAQWDFIQHNGAAAVVPVMEDGTILMVRQYRNALERYTLEIPAGALDTVEEPGIHCASRELEEETGYRSDHLQWLITVRTTVAFCNERIEIFVADHLVASKQNLDEDEFIDVKPYTIEELTDKIYAGEIEDSKTIAALLAYEKKYRHHN
ncbi:MAG: NUDIX hydrolase [Lachnospiraceae bacterium]